MLPKSNTKERHIHMIHRYEIPCMDLQQIHQSGQCFRMVPLPEHTYPSGARNGYRLISGLCVLRAWQDGSCDIAVLPFPIDGGSPFMQENLFVCVPKDHELATHKSLTFADINGFNFLLRTELGFWDALCREKMPASKFLVQTDNAVFDELVRASSLPCFSTDYGNLQGGYPERVNIPLADEEAHVIFYLAKK